MNLRYRAGKHPVGAPSHRDSGAEVAAALLSIERRINSATFWILTVVAGTAGLIIAVLK